MQENWSPAVPPASEPMPERDRGIRPFEALKFLFTGEDAWTNVGLGLVFLIIPMVGPLVLLGWQTEIFQRLVRKHPRPIPKLSFSDFNAYIGRGVPAFLVQMLLAIPIGGSVGFLIGILNAVVSFSSASTRRGALSSSFDPTPLYIVAAVFGLLILALIPVFMLISNAATTRAELTQDIGTALRPGPLFAYLKDSLWPAALGLFLYSWLASLAIFLGLFVFCIGLYAAVIIVRVGMVHLRFQIYESYLAHGGTPMELKPHLEPLPSEAQRY